MDLVAAHTAGLFGSASTTNLFLALVEICGGMRLAAQDWAWRGGVVRPRLIDLVFGSSAEVCAAERMDTEVPTHMFAIVTCTHEYVRVTPYTARKSTALVTERDA